MFVRDVARSIVPSSVQPSTVDGGPLRATKTFPDHPGVGVKTVSCLAASEGFAST
jgi:hypothetical protein